MDILHAVFPCNSEYTLCGDAFDLNALDDTDCNSPIFVQKGQRVSCPKCIKAISEIKNSYTSQFKFKGDIP